ncbi:hypothetical protein QQG55_33135 [Brugia pahangi]
MRVTTILLCRVCLYVWPACLLSSRYQMPSPQCAAVTCLGERGSRARSSVMLFISSDRSVDSMREWWPSRAGTGGLR